MVEKSMRALKHKILYRFAVWISAFVGPMPITLGSLFFGICAAVAAACNAPFAALFLWLSNRILDGLDGEVARARGDSSDLGGYVDMMSDVVVYAAIPLGIVYAQGELVVTAAVLVMISAFYINITSWTYLSALIEKRRIASEPKLTSIEMPPGLIEGTETIIVYGILVTLPDIAVPVAIVTAIASFLSAGQRIFWAIRWLRT